MTAAQHHGTGPTRHRGGHPVIKGFLILVGVGLFIRLLPYLLAALLIAGLIWCLVKLCQVSTRKTTARKHRKAASLRAQQQAQLHEQRRLEAFLLPEDSEWLRVWTQQETPAAKSTFMIGRQFERKCPQVNRSCRVVALSIAASSSLPEGKR